MKACCCDETDLKQICAHVLINKTSGCYIDVCLMLSCAAECSVTNSRNRVRHTELCVPLYGVSSAATTLPSCQPPFPDQQLDTHTHCSLHMSTVILTNTKAHSGPHQPAERPAADGPCGAWTLISKHQTCYRPDEQKLICFIPLTCSQHSLFTAS